MYKGICRIKYSVCGSDSDSESFVHKVQGIQRNLSNKKKRVFVCFPHPVFSPIVCSVYLIDIRKQHTGDLKSCIIAFAFLTHNNIDCLMMSGRKEPGWVTQHCSRTVHVFLSSEGSGLRASLHLLLLPCSSSVPLKTLWTPQIHQRLWKAMRTKEKERDLRLQSKTE